ncbi:MAG: hypothetical protein KKD27_04625, partial [Gammaproteobacteria bacterium]|nr:hypothetical protein [Gammaproteobacteria bacterium]MBU1461603.1 hypothetical protein [Gammaproteobacteria bacterium]MBU2281857.1 hypothetical protein [Gammaproteobacteria bacterium]MBU2371272.1 hypothetical protein [Gammaproteobacteria bacterium]
LDELAVDEVAVTGLEGNDSAFAAGMGVTHGESPGLVIVLGLLSSSVEQSPFVGWRGDVRCTAGRALAAPVLC